MTAALIRARRAEPFVPWAVAGLAALVWLALGPPTPDLAAQAYRSALFAREGFAVWDGAWYGGHHLPAYSLLFPPLGALLGPRLVGVLAVLASVAAFQALTTRHFGPRVGRITALWFGLVAVGDLVIGRITFALGIAVGLYALLALQRGRGRTAVALGVACAAASPVAGLFLALAGASAAWGAKSRSALLMAAASMATILALTTAFPEGGHDPFIFGRALLPVLAAAALFLLSPRSERTLRTGAVLYAAACLVALAVPSPVGSNIARLGVLFGGPLLAAVALRHGRGPSRAWAAAAAIALLMGWQIAGPLREASKGIGDPSTTTAYYAPLIRWLGARPGPTERVEVPFTRGHWEAARLAPYVPLARGWETQLDVKYEPFFYRRNVPYPASQYRSWLHANAVGYVAVPDTPPDPSSRRELALIRTRPPWLRPVWSNAHWRVFAVVAPSAIVSGPARLVRLEPSGFTIAAHGPDPILVRVRPTPYFTVTRGSACVGPGPGGWTRVTALRPGVIRIEARFDAERVFDSSLRCMHASD